MIKYVWDTAVGNTLSVIVGNVPELHCYRFFTISLLEGGIQCHFIPFSTRVTFPVNECEIFTRSFPEMELTGWAVAATASPGTGAVRIRSILWDNRVLGPELEPVVGLC